MRGMRPAVVLFVWRCEAERSSSKGLFGHKCLQVPSNTCNLQSRRHVTKTKTEIVSFVHVNRAELVFVNGTFAISSNVYGKAHQNGKTRELGIYNL